VLERTRARVADTQRRAVELGERERQEHESVAAVFDMVDRDSETAGGIIAGALAYKLFIWLLPLALVVVAGLGITADAAGESPQEAAEDAGLGGLVSTSIASAASSSGRWYALIVGVPILIYVTRSVLRALIGAHRLLWRSERASVPRPTLAATLRLLVLLLALPVVSGIATFLRDRSPGIGLLGTLLAMLPFAGLWLLVAMGLPHRDAPWTALIPGALVFGFGCELLQVVLAYFLVPYALAKQGTYGALGVAAALLFGLYLISRLVVASAVVNATLWDRRRGVGSGNDGAPRPGV
jgi:membrane protein